MKDCIFIENTNIYNLEEFVTLYGNRNTILLLFLIQNSDQPHIMLSFIIEYISGLLKKCPEDYLKDINKIINDIEKFL